MSAERSQAIAWFFSINVYLLIVSTYTLFTQGGARGFFISLGVLCGFRVMFSVIEGAGDALAWHLHGKHAPSGQGPPE